MSYNKKITIFNYFKCMKFKIINLVKEDFNKSVVFYKITEEMVK